MNRNSNFFSLDHALPKIILAIPTAARFNLKYYMKEQSADQALRSRDE